MPPKPSNDKSLKAAMDDMLHSFHLDQKFQQQKIIAAWEVIMGKAVSNRTSKIYFSNKKLFVYLSSASLREELLNEREKIIKRLNEEAGGEVVEEIVFT